MAEKKTGEEIIEIICEKASPSEFGHDDYNSKEIGLGSRERVDSVTEVDGHAHVVDYFEDHDVYIKLTGYYNSYESFAEFSECGKSDFSIVKPSQRMVTFYD